MQVLAVIPARAGSRGIPLKNLAVVAGKTLLRRAIESAQAATRINRLIVSTEDVRIGLEANRLGCTVEFRPDELATDEATTLSVLQWHLGQADVKPDAVLCLQPTCPLRQAEDIDGAIALMEKTDCDSIISIVKNRRPPERMVILFPDGRIRPRESDNEFTMRQYLPTLYNRSGDIYLIRSNVLSAATCSAEMKGDDCRAWVMDDDRDANIDERLDLVTAEALVKYHEGRTC